MHQANITITLPRKCSVSKLKWVSVWCRKFKVNFADLVADFTVDKASTSRPRDTPQRKKFVGNFSNKQFDNCVGPRRGKRCHHGISGKVFAVDAQTLLVEGFTYDGSGRCKADTFFLAGLEGDAPPPNKQTAAGRGILLTRDNAFYSYEDAAAPGIRGSFDGVSDTKLDVNKRNSNVYRVAMKDLHRKAVVRYFSR